MAQVVGNAYKELELSPFKEYSEPELDRAIRICKKSESNSGKTIKKDDSTYMSLKRAVLSKHGRDEAIKEVNVELSKILVDHTFVRINGDVVVLENSLPKIIKRLAERKWNLEEKEVRELIQKTYRIELSTTYRINKKITKLLDEVLRGRSLDVWFNQQLDEINVSDLPRYPSDTDYNTMRMYVLNMERQINKLVEKRDAYAIGIVTVCRELKMYTKADYDNLVLWTEMWELIQRGQTNRGGITSTEIKVFLERHSLIRHGVSEEYALKTLEQYCMSEGIPVDFTGTVADRVLCTCGALVPDTVSNCTVCGHVLTFTCPKCGKSTPSKENFCSGCGMDISFYKSTDKVESVLKSAIESCDIAFLSEILNGLGNNKDRVDKDILRAATDLTDRYEMTLRELDDLIEQRRLYSAQSVFNNYLKTLPDTIPQKNIGSIIEKMNRCNVEIGIIEQSLHALPTMSVRDGIELCIYVEERCVDCPEVIAYLKSRRPEKPKKVIVSESPDGYPKISITPFAEDDGVFIIVRGEEKHIPIGSGGKEVTCNTLEYIDRDITFGKEYYYSVHTVKCGMTSMTFTCGNSIALFSKVQNVTATSEQGGVKISFTAPPGCDRVWLSKPSGPIPAIKPSEAIDIGTTGEYLDMDAIDEKRVYKYMLVAEYSKGRSSPVKTRPVSVSCRPVPIHLPVTGYEVKCMGDGSFEAIWDMVPTKCDLYFSTTDLTEYGTVVTEDFVQKNLVLLDCKMNKKRDGARFELDEGMIGYVYVVKDVGHLNVLSEPKLVYNVSPVRNPVCRFNNDRYVLVFDWPKQLKKAIVCYDDTSYPDSTDAGKRMEITNEEYDKNGRIYINDRLNRIFISIYASYKNGVLSAPVHVESGIDSSKKKIEYRIEKKFIGDIKIVFKTDKDVSVLPNLKLVGSKTGFPSPDDTTISEIRDEVAVNGEHVVTVDKKKCKEFKSLELYFENEPDKDIYELINSR